MKRKTKYGRWEGGQTLVLFALASMGLIAFLALAVDGGLAYSEKREAQNGSDSGALAGAFEVRRQNRSGQTVNQQQVLREVHQAAERHGVPDTDGIPGNEVNGNIVVYYTNTKGHLTGRIPNGNRVQNDAGLNNNGQPRQTICHVPPGNPEHAFTITVANPAVYEGHMQHGDYEGACGDEFCQVGTSCTDAMAEDAWGVRVVVEQPFDTYFAGIVGFDRITAEASSTAVTHAGIRAWDNTFWALFSLDAPDLACEPSNNGSNGEGQMHTAINEVIGNVHSNGSFSFDNGVRNNAITGRLTHATSGNRGCQRCNNKATEGEYEDRRIALELPSVSEYQERAWEETNFGGSGYYSADHTVNAGGILGDPWTQPFTYVNGNLTIAGAGATLNGLIYVAGDVTFAAGSSTSARFSIVATGKITVEPGASVLAEPFNIVGDSLLGADQHNFVFFTSKDYSQGGGNACADPVIELDGNGQYINAGFLAPRGRVEVKGDNFIFGSIVGNTIVQSGSARITASPDSFPPQPDRVELLY